MKNIIANFNAFRKEHRRTGRIALIIFLAAAVLLVPYIYSLARSLGSAETGIFGLPLLAGSSAAIEGEISVENLQNTDLGIPLPEPWDGAERITILMMGLDYRDWSADLGPSRTDTMILFTIDPLTKTAGMLSIPRDLWTVIPGFSPNKINTAYYFGELYNVPGGGPALAMKTVEQTIGVPIDYYAQVDFNTFINFIDLLGGVKIDVPSAITIDPLGSDTIPKNLEPGRQTLNGILTLAYARERHAPGGDFARSQRQQQIVIGIRDRILEYNLLPGLIANAGAIYNELSAGIDTNIPLDDLLRIIVLAIQIDLNDIQRGVIGEDYIIYGNSPDDLAILIPIPDKIRALRDEIFTNNTALGPLTSGSPEEKLVSEAARISIQNGSADSGIGISTQNFLASLGANIVESRSASGSYNNSVLVDHTGNPFTLAYVASLMNISNARIIHEFDPNSPIDIEIIIGNDWANSNPFP